MLGKGLKCVTEEDTSSLVCRRAVVKLNPVWKRLRVYIQNIVPATPS